MSRSPEAIIKRHVKLCAAALNVAARLRHTGKDKDADVVTRLVQSHQWAVQKIAGDEDTQ